MLLRLLGRVAMSMLGGAVLIGTAWWAIGDHERQRRIAELEAERAELLRVISRLKTERRVARLFVVDQKKDDGGQVVETTVEFMPIGPLGNAGPVKSVTIPGDVCYVDALVVRFLDNYVEKGDTLRGHTLHLFRRIFGEQQRPADGFALDDPGDVPDTYRVDSEPSRFERRLWARFWQYASDPALAAEMGVRVAQGEAAYQRLRKGQLWQVATRADGGLEMTLMPLDPLISDYLRKPTVN